MVYFARFRYGLSVPMSGPDIEKTAFATPRGGPGLYQYAVMPFGLCNMRLQSTKPVVWGRGTESRRTMTVGLITHFLGILKF